MTAPNPLAARRRTNSSSCSAAVPSSWEESVVSGAIANRFAISRPLLNLSGDQTIIDQTSDILKLVGRIGADPPYGLSGYTPVSGLTPGFQGAMKKKARPCLPQLG